MKKVCKNLNQTMKTKEIKNGSIYFWTNSFSEADMCYSETAKRLGIFNHPEGNFEKENIDRVWRKLVTPIMSALVIHPIDGHKKVFKLNSGYRCLELNRKIGSSDNSAHTRGEAIDFEIVGIDNEILFNWLINQHKDGKLIYDQCILEKYNRDYGDPAMGWIHLSIVANNNRGQSFRIN